jgi:hypothetical protein
MKKKAMNNLQSRLTVAASVLFVILLLVQVNKAASWNGIVPLKSSRADVERILGAPLKAQEGDDGPMQFKVLGGIVTVGFVSPKFAETKGLSKESIGKVLQIVLQHESSSETPESMKLGEKKDFAREEQSGNVIYRNEKDGIMYTFINGTLKTTYYVPALSQLSKGGKYSIF